jgi:hypothetical protein
MLQRLLPLLGVLIGCAPTSTSAPPQPSMAAGSSTAAKGAQRAAAREVVRGDHPWAAEDRRIPPAKEHFSGELFAELPFPVNGGAPQRLSRDTVGLLEITPGQYTGIRVLASRDRVHRIQEPKELVRVCVARDGRATFAIQQGGKLLTSPSFDAPMRSLGTVEREVSGSFLVVDEGKRSFVDCRRGTIDDISKIRGYPSLQHHSETLTLISFDDDLKRSCRLRVVGSNAWEDLPRCSHASLYADGLVRVLVTTPDGNSTKCAFAVDVEGKRRPCGPDASAGRYTAPERPIDFRLARFAAPNLLVVVGEKGLYLMPATGTRADLTLIAPGHCTPIGPISPLFRCFSDDHRTARVVSVDTTGKARDELSRTLRAGQDLRFFETAGGALATGGECDGNPGDVACVRQPSGAWKSIPFAADLVKVLHTLAPGTLILPTVAGELFVATGVPEGPLSIGSVDLSVYKADAGLVTRAGKMPLWIAGDTAGTSGSRFLFGGTTSPNKTPSFLWRTATTFSAWPLERMHPAFQTPESCRLDVSLDGSINVACVSGDAHAVGRFGIVEKKRGELVETYNGGATWTPVLLPEGVDTSDIECAAIGCRIGPYFRLGWGL